MAEPSRIILCSIIERYRPRGWKVIEKWPEDQGGFVTRWGRVSGITVYHEKTIYCLPVFTRESLYVFLHECGHVHLGHGDDHESALALHEFEAEEFAKVSMRSMGIAVPRGMLRSAREYVRSCIESQPEVDQERRVLQFAYGSKWREHI